MKPEEQKKLLKALHPVLKDKATAEQILARFYQDHMALVWSVEDVARAANEKEMVLTRAEARKVLRDLESHHNKQYGIRWSDVTDGVEEFVLGREITKAELRRFVDQDIVTMDSNTSRKSKPR